MLLLYCCLLICISLNNFHRFFFSSLLLSVSLICSIVLRHKASSDTTYTHPLYSKRVSEKKMRGRAEYRCTFLPLSTKTSSRLRWRSWRVIVQCTKHNRTLIQYVFTYCISYIYTN